MRPDADPAEQTLQKTLLRMADPSITGSVLFYVRARRITGVRRSYDLGEAPLLTRADTPLTPDLAAILPRLTAAATYVGEGEIVLRFVAGRPRLPFQVTEHEQIPIRATGT